MKSIVSGRVSRGKRYSYVAEVFVETELSPYWSKFGTSQVKSTRRSKSLTLTIKVYTSVKLSFLLPSGVEYQGLFGLLRRVLTVLLLELVQQVSLRCAFVKLVQVQLQLLHLLSHKVRFRCWAFLLQDRRSHTLCIASWSTFAILLNLDFFGSQTTERSRRKCLVKLLIRRVKHLLGAFLLKGAEEIVRQCCLLKSFETLLDWAVLAILTYNSPAFIYSYRKSIVFELGLVGIWCLEVISNNDVLLILWTFIHVSVGVDDEFGALCVVTTVLHLDVAARLGGGAGTCFHCFSLDKELFVRCTPDVCCWHWVRCSLLHAWIGAITEDLDMLFLDFADLLLQHQNFVFQ